MGKRAIAALGISLLLTAAVAFGAQKPKQKAWAGLPVVARLHPILFGAGPLVLNLQSVPKGTDWAVGVKVEPWAVPEAEVALVGRSLHFENIPFDFARITPGSITLWGRSFYSGRKLVIYLLLPHSLPVRIKKNGVTVATTTFNKGFMVRNGQVLAEVPNSLISVIKGFFPSLIFAPEKLGSVGPNLNR